MSLEVISRRLKARQAEPAPEPAPAGSLDQLVDQMVEARVKAILSEEQDQPRRNRHLPTFDQGQGFDSSPQPSPAAVPIAPPGDFSAVLEKDETGRTVALDVTAHGRRERFVVLRDGRGRAIGMRLQQDAHPLPPAPSEGN